MPDTPDRALIIGGGIGGLATGLALHRAGVAVTVFERQDEVREVGAGLAVWANAIKVLRQLGVADEVVGKGTEMHDYRFLAPDGGTLIYVNIDDLTRKVGAPSVVVRRADVQAALYRALGEERVELGANCIGYDQDADGVTAKFESGREERGRFLIGADGIRSTVRTAVAGPHELRYSGYKSWRSIATFSDPSFPPGSWWLYWGRGARFGLAHVGNGSIYWYAMVNAPARASDDPSDRWDRVLRRFQGYSHPVEALIQATPRDSIIVNDLNDVPPIATWGEGRVTLVGDAAHPTTPNMGQGACQAIEDAAVLSKQVAAVDSLGDGAAIARALRAYESNRISRAHRVTNLSWRIGSIGQWENPFAVGVRNVILRVLPNSLMRKSLESNLAFDV